MDKGEIAQIVAEVLRRLDDKVTAGYPAATAVAQQAPQGAAEPGARKGLEFVFGDLEEAVETAARAQAEFQEMGLEKRNRIIAAMRKVSIANAERLARMALDETGMGRYEDKVQKDLLVATKTPGTECLKTEATTGDKGLTLVEYAPFGVVGAVTPSTNPTSTIIHNSISILAAGNSVVFAPHPAAMKCGVEAMRLLVEAIVSAGGPKGLIVTVEPPSPETVRALLAHPKVRLNLVTGGPAIVRIAMGIGKACKTIAAGPGNPPVVVDETAILPKAAQDIISGASFDNGVLCTAEKEVIVVSAIKSRFLEAMRADPRAYELTFEQLEKLTRLVIVEGGKGCRAPKLNRDYVGKDAAVIAQGIGLSVPESTRLLWAETSNDHPLVWTEQLMPVLPVTEAPDVDAAIELAVEVEGHEHHTAAMHSMNVANLTKMARRMACSIYVKNAPTFYGLGMGEGYASVSIGTPTGDGMTKATHFVRPLQCSLVGYFRIA